MCVFLLHNYIRAALKNNGISNSSHTRSIIYIILISLAVHNLSRKI